MLLSPVPWVMPPPVGAPELAVIVLQRHAQQSHAHSAALALLHANLQLQDAQTSSRLELHEDCGCGSGGHPLADAGLGGAAASPALTLSAVDEDEEAPPASLGPTLPACMAQTYTTTFPSLPPDCGCGEPPETLDASALGDWDGSFSWVNGSGSNDGQWWNPAPGAKLQGNTLLGAGTNIQLIKPAGAPSYWQMTIACFGGGILWQGNKDTGPTPAGQYTQTAGCGLNGANGQTLTVSGPEVRIDLIVDQLPAADEETVGAFIPINDDFDEDNQNPLGTPARDNQPHDPDGSTGPIAPVHRIVPDDDELIAAQLKVTGVGPAKWTLTFPTARVKVWRPDPQGGTGWVEVQSGVQSEEVPVATTVDLLIEGITASSSLRDVTIGASVTNNDGVTCNDTVNATVTSVNLTAYRPRHTAATPYAMYGRHFVREAHEESPTLGPGIRLNGDDDDGDGVKDSADEGGVALEDDLIEVSTLVAPAGAQYTLQRSTTDLEIWTSSTKQPGANVFPAGQLAVSISGMNLATLWVEWTAAGHGTGDLIIQGPSGTALDRDKLVFHTFQSLVIALGGRDQAPTLPIDPNFGVFEMAENLYLRGTTHSGTMKPSWRPTGWGCHTTRSVGRSLEPSPISRFLAIATGVGLLTIWPPKRWPHWASAQISSATSMPSLAEPPGPRIAVHRAQLIT